MDGKIHRLEIWRNMKVLCIRVDYLSISRGEISAFGMNKTCQVYLILMAELVLRDEWR